MHCDKNATNRLHHLADLRLSNVVAIEFLHTSLNHRRSYFNLDFGRASFVR